MQEELTEEQIKGLTEAQEQAKQLGLDYAGFKIMNGDIITDERMIKVNLPDTNASFESGNGEGIWAVPLTEVDEQIYHNSKSKETFQVALLNTAIYYPFPWGSIITVETRGNNRPVLNYEWMDQVIKKTEPGFSLAQLLEKNEQE